jgi:hypothetical protein
MKREDFKKIIKARSFWKIDKRTGDYMLPNGTHLSSYVKRLICEQMSLDRVAIAENGEFYFAEKGENNYSVYAPVGKNETCPITIMLERIDDLVRDIVGGTK